MDNNKIIYKADIKELCNLQIKFTGKNNILAVEEGVRFNKSSIVFSGNNSVVYLSRNRHPYKLNVLMNTDNALYIGQNTYINQQIHIILSEHQNIIIGSECLLSLGIWLRTADPHLVYDAKTHQRINPSKSILIGDHVWIGQDSLILKGTMIGSGSIVGGHSVVSNKVIPSNTVWGGNPARQLRGNVFFKSDCVHNWTAKDTEQHQMCDDQDNIYKTTQSTVQWNALDQRLMDAALPENRLQELQQLAKNCEKSRFAISAPTTMKHKIIHGKGDN